MPGLLPRAPQRVETGVMCTRGVSIIIVFYAMNDVFGVPHLPHSLQEIILFGRQRSWAHIILYLRFFENTDLEARTNN